MECQYCKRNEFKNHNSFRNHQRCCKENPNRVLPPACSPEYRNKHPIWNKGLTNDSRCKRSDETKRKLSVNSSKQVWSDASRKILSEHAKRRGLGGHTSKKRLNYIKKDGSVVHFQSSYETRFAQILDELDVYWTRPEHLIWTDDKGEWHRYYPDFKIGKRYFDTKNDYLAIKDADKIQRVREQNNVDVVILRDHEINKKNIQGLVHW